MSITLRSDLTRPLNKTEVDGNWQEIKDLSSIENGKGASKVAIEDAAGNFTSTTVEGALAEISAGAAGIWTELSPGAYYDGSITVGKATFENYSAIPTIIQCGDQAIWSATKLPSSSGFSEFLQNAYWDGTAGAYKYINDGPASLHGQANGYHYFWVAASGTAGDNVSFSEALTFNPTGDVSGTIIKDEDTMSSDSATHLATQQSIKAYVDSNSHWTQINNDIYYDVTGGGVVLGHSSPQEWHTGWQYIEVGKWGSVSASDSSGVMDIARNYYNATTNADTRIDAGYAQALHFEPATGEITLRVSASDVLGSTITWIDALTIGPTGTISGISIKDDDTMADNSALHLATQQSIKAYVDNNTIDSSGVTYEALNTNGDVGTSAGTLAIGNHTHSGVYEPADATILKDADIGVSVASEGHTHEGTEVLSTAVTDGYVLTADGAGNSVWEASAGGGSSTLDGLTDTTITSIASGEVLKWNGSAWINNTLAEAGISATSHNHSGVYEPADATILKDADIGSTLQAYDADLTVLGGLAKTDSNFIVGNGATWVAESGATARASLGLTIGTDVQAYSATNALTSDITYGTLNTNGDVGTGAGQLAIGDHTHATYAPLASPTFTGNPTAPTATAGDNDTTIATTAFVTTAVAAVSSPWEESTSYATDIVFSTGVVGIGVTFTQNWAATSYALEVGDRGSLSYTSNATYTSHNFYYNAGDKFLTTGWASQYAMFGINGAHTFKVSSASGTAGAAITWTTGLQVVAGGDCLTGTNAALATTATAGFLYIPVTNGAPTGTPTNAGVNNAAIVFDRTNNKLYVYDGGWLSTAALT